MLRRHWHVITALTDLEHNRAICTDHNFRKHEEASREIERHLGHERVQGAHIGRFGVERPERTPTHAEHQQEGRGGVSAKEAKDFGAELWNATDRGKALNAALKEHGWMLARGDKVRADGSAYFMAIDPQGEAHELRRMVPVKAAELYARMADINAARLPSISDVRERMQTEREEFARDLAAYAREQDQAARLSRNFGAAQARVTEPGVFDRDAADDAWSKAVDAAAIKAAQAAARQREAPAASSAPGQENTHATARERAAEEVFREHDQRARLRA